MTARTGLGTCLALLFGLGAAGCRRPVPSDSRAAFDPELVDPEPGAFHETFEGPPARLVLGTGWYGPEQVEKVGPLSGFSWAASSATVYFGMPDAPEIDLAARCASFTFPGAPAQTMTPVLNGNPLPAVAVPSKWGELRLPLPAGTLRAPINKLELRFAYAVSPEKTLQSADPRELSVLFSDLTVVPAGFPIADAFPSIRRVSGGRHELTLRGRGLAIPLPAGDRYALHLGAARSSVARTRVTIELWKGAGKRQKLWSGFAAKLEGKDIEFSVGAPGIAMVLFRLLPNAAGVVPDTAAVVFELDPPEVFPAPAAVAAGSKPNVFLYVIDTLRADVLGTYGSRLSLTPRIDSFSRDAVVYERAWSSSSWTLPAIVSILSGVYPFEHGLTDIDDDLPAKGVAWLPEELSRLGYETAAFLQWMLPGRSFGFERGFDGFFLNVGLSVKSRPPRMRNLLWQYLFYRRPAGRPLFAYVHVSDPHALYEPTGKDLELADRQPGTLAPQLYNPHVFLAQGLGENPADRAHLRALYDGEVRYTDRQFGAFLDMLRYLGLYEGSMIILVSDHGEEFYEHGGFDHGRTLYEELVHVPLVVKFPGSQGGGTRVAARVSTIDVMPTVLELAGRRFGDLRLQGRPLPRSRQADGRELIAETRVRAGPTEGPVDLLAVVDGDVTCIRNQLREDRFFRPARALDVYDLATDPGQHSPLADRDPRVGACRTVLGTWLARGLETSQRKKRPERVLPPEEIRRLRALGYLH